MITTGYGSWLNHMQYSTTVDEYCCDAFGTEGVYGFDFQAIVDDFREAINDELPEGVRLVGDEFIGPFYRSDRQWDPEDYPMTDWGSLDISAIIEGIDFWAIADRHKV